MDEGPKDQVKKKKNKGYFGFGNTGGNEIFDEEEIKEYELNLQYLPNFLDQTNFSIKFKSNADELVESKITHFK